MTDNSNGTQAIPPDRLHDLARSSRVLQALVRSAAQIGDATSASLFLIDEASATLHLVIALGPRAAAVQDVRLPLGHGIAGLVAATGQPLVVSDAGNDPRQARDIAEKAGYIPESIACVPVILRDDIIGVLELLDKQGDATFSLPDLERLSDLAGPVAEAIAALRPNDAIGAITPRAQLQALTDLLAEIAAHGEAELEACHTVLTGFATYLKSRPHQNRPSGSPR